MVRDIKLHIHNRIFQFFAFLIISLLICSPLCASSLTSHSVYANEVNAQLSAENQTIHRGETFDVDVNVSGNTGILTLFLTIKYNHNVFKLINVQQVRQSLGELNLEHSGSGYDYIDERTGGFNLFWDGSRPDSTNGTAVRLTFQSSLTANIGTYPINLVVDEENTTKAYKQQANVQVTSPQITLIEGAYIVVWHDWNGMPVVNTNITNHPYNLLTGGYEYNSEENLNIETDFPNDPERPEDDMYTYEFAGWEGAVWRGETPNDSSVIYYVAKYNNTPKTYVVWYYVDGYGDTNAPDGEITEEELYTAKDADFDSIIDDKVLPFKHNYTFYGWYTDSSFTHKLITPLMPARDLKLYGYFKYNIRETDIPSIQLVYRETITNNELENIAYIDVNITKNYGLSSLMITLSEFDTSNFTFYGFEKGEIFKQMSFIDSGEETELEDGYKSFSWNNSYKNSYEIGRLLVLKFKIKSDATPGAYEVKMTANTQNTTYVIDGEIWYSNVEFINTKIPIGNTNYWIQPIPGTEETIEVESENFVPFNIELVVISLSNEVEDIIDSESLKEIISGNNLMVHSLFDIYFQQNATRITKEQFSEFFGEKYVKVKLKLTPLQLSCKNLNIYYVDDDGKMNLYDSKVEKGYLTFETNHFSNWALVGDYMLTNVETSSAKLLRVSLLFFGISASALLAIAFVRNRKKQLLIVYKNGIKGGNED